jgi:hypothetical protein
MESTHPPCGYVEKMTRVVRGVDSAEPKLAVALDQRDTCARRTSAQQMQSEQGAAEAGADDGDRGSRHVISPGVATRATGQVGMPRLGRGRAGRGVIA